VPRLEQFLGSGAGLSAASITPLTAQWQDEATAFGQRDLAGTDFLYPWVDGVHLKVRLDQENPTESTFATVRLRTKVTKGSGSPGVAGIAMAYKLIDAAQARWHAVNAPHLVALVRAGATFHKESCLNGRITPSS
jgi:hypothetical protein